jgi:hypothetical protein
MKGNHFMKRLLFASLFALTALSPALAQTTPGDATAENPERGAKGAQDVRPGSVGPGSEKNSEVAPTSPSVPMKAQPPPEIPADQGSTGAGSGTNGTGQSQPDSDRAQ